jgi:hypothetical protein
MTALDKNITSSKNQKTTSNVFGQSCDFCLIPSTKTTSYFQDLYGNLEHTLTIKGVPENFTVLQDLVPIAEYGGHLLLMPNLHHISLATIEDQTSLKTASDAIVSTLQSHFPHNPLFIFEHGPGFIEGEPIACGGCHLDHAHGHIMILPEGSALDPIRQKAEAALISNGWSNLEKNRFKTKKMFTDIQETTKLNPYLYLGMVYPNKTTNAYIYVQNSKDFMVASQLLRTVVSEVIYNKSRPSEWHWRDIHTGLSTPEKKRELKAKIMELRNLIIK